MQRIIRFSLLVIMLITAFCCRAEHLKFMGIPIDGTISSFQQKLIAKGWKYDEATSKNSTDPMRFFTGTFAGDRAQLAVAYNSKTKKVWLCIVNFDNRCTLAEARRIFEIKKDLLASKYSGEALMCDMYEDGCPDDTFEMLIFKKPIQAGSPCLGSINLTIEEDESIFGENQYEYSIWLIYEDEINSSKNASINVEDY